MYLDRIVETKKVEVEQLKSTLSVSQAESQIAEMDKCRGFARALGERKNRTMGLIAEVKKASPSKGLIRPDFHPVTIAQGYKKALADCISVLTDVEYFQGSNAYLQAVREVVDLPILRKDFTIDFRQIYEARIIGADAILLIAAILSADQIREYSEIAQSIGLDVLVEIHDLDELNKVLDSGAKLQMIGINNRNLRTFETDIHKTEQLITHIPKEVVIVSESGISSNEEIKYLLSMHVDAVLVGETFMRQPSVEAAIQNLMGDTRKGDAR